ncbi:MAG: hypothetical protein AAFZ15_00240 [Bacteroidota bacterium]
MQTISYSLDGRNITIPKDYIHLVTMKYRKDFYREFDIEAHTFRRKLKKAGIDLPTKGMLDIPTVLRIYLVFGWPPKMNIKLDRK